MEKERGSRILASYNDASNYKLYLYFIAMNKHNPDIEGIVEEFNDRSNDRMFLEDECKNSFWFEEGEDIRYDQDEAGAWLLKKFQSQADEYEREKGDMFSKTYESLKDCVIFTKDEFDEFLKEYDHNKKVDLNRRASDVLLKLKTLRETRLEYGVDLSE